MKLKMIIVLGLLFLVSQVNAQENPVLKNQKEKMSYIIGMSIGNNLKRQSVEVELNSFVKGVEDALGGKKPLLSEQEIREMMTAFENEMRVKQEVAAQKNKEQGDSFLAENKKKEGVKTLESGLQYKVITTGTGKKPKLNDYVLTHYRGTLIDGTEFDSTYKRGQPAFFQVSSVIPGWTEALQLMEVGAKWQLFIPPNLAFGESGAGGLVGPNATVIFEMELLSVQDKK